LAKYRKKPVVIDAIQNTGEWKPIIDWLDEISGGKFSIPFGHRPPIILLQDGRLRIETLEGVHQADIGDYIICGIKGEFYPCKPDIFENTYEEVS